MSSSKGISPHATAFIHSYARATALGSTDPSASAQAMSSHYLIPLTSFTLGTTTTITSTSSAATGTLSHLQKLQRAGLGSDIRLIRIAVKEIGEFSAAVFVTWELVVGDYAIADAERDAGGKTGKKAKGWRWRNCYGYRRMEGAAEDGGVKEGFEYIVSDEEVGELVKRMPGYFEL